MSQVLDPAAQMQAAEETLPERRSAPAVVVERLARQFGRRSVLRDVSFSVPAGSAFGVAGANGSGKTVLLRILATLDRPSSGRARILELDTLSHTSRVRRAIGYVSEDPLLYSGITPDQFLHFVGRSRGLGGQVRQVTVDTLLEVVGLDDRRHRDIGSLSPGERRRLALAGALVHEPRVLLLDDPLRGLDGLARLEQIEVLRELRRMENTIVATGTRPEDLLEICDQMAVLRDGAIAWSGGEQDALRLATPEQGAGVRVKLEVLDGLEPAIMLLSQHHDVQELEAEEDGLTVWFLFLGQRQALADLLPQLIRAGCSVAHFGIERRTPSNAIANLFGGPA